MDTEAGEHVIFEGHPSWRSILGFYVGGALLVALAGAIAAGVTRATGDKVDWGAVTVVVIVAAAVLLIVGLIRRIATTYTITNHRLHIRRGLISRHVQQTRLERVQNVNTNQSVIQRVLQVGTVDFDTAGSGDSDFAFVGVAQPEKVMTAVDKAQREHAAESPQPGGEQPGGGRPSADQL
jgi:uncharacterized membrane protein YdbT with pleckstrin-like domain